MRATLNSFREHFRTGGDQQFTANWHHRDAYNVIHESKLSEGGALAGDEAVAAVVATNLRDASPMRRVSTVGRTDRASAINLSLMDDQGAEGRIINFPSENEPTDTDPEIGMATNAGFTFTSDRVKGSLALLEDAHEEFPGVLLTALSTRIGLRQNRAFTVGTGSNEPAGIVPHCTVGKTAANPTSFSIDEIFDLIAAVDPVYQVNGTLMLHSETLAYLRKIKDGEGRYQFEASGLARVPRVLNDHMPTIAAGAKPIVYGDFRRGYRITDIGQFRSQLLLNRYADRAQVAWIGFQRGDGNVADKHAVKALQLAAS